MALGRVGRIYMRKHLHTYIIIHVYICIYIYMYIYERIGWLRPSGPLPKMVASLGLGTRPTWLPWGWTHAVNLAP